MTARICAVDGCLNPMPTGDNSTSCPGCWNKLAVDLGNMTWLVQELNVTITRQARVALESSGIRKPDDDDKYVEVDPRGLLPGLQGLRPQPTVVRSAVKPLPIDLAASDALELLHATLWPWVREGMEAHPPIVVHGPARNGAEWPVRYETVRAPRPGVVGLSASLLCLRGWLQGHPDGQLAIEEVAYAVKAATRAIDRTPDRTCLGRCGNVINDVTCGDWLYVARGSVIGRCDTCHAEYDVAERERGLLEMARDRLVTTTEACAAVRTYGKEGQNITAEQIRQWKARGRLMSRGHTLEVGKQRPVDLWLLGDVIDLATA